jgi:putative endonuclease
MSDWFLYLIRCRHGSLYTGISTDVARRFAEHQNGSGAKFLRGRVPLALVFQRKIGNLSLTLAVESRVKKLPKPKKEELITTATSINQIVKQAKTRLA